MMLINDIMIEKYKFPDEIYSDELVPLRNVLEDMLAIDVYFYTGLIKSQLLATREELETINFLIVLEQSCIKLEIDKNNMIHLDPDKKSVDFLVEHFDSLLDVPIGEDGFGRITKVLDSLDNFEAHTVLKLLTNIRARIVGGYDWMMNVTEALSIVSLNELKRKEREANG